MADITSTANRTLLDRLGQHAARVLAMQPPRHRHTWRYWWAIGHVMTRECTTCHLVQEHVPGSRSERVTWRTISAGADDD